MKTSDVQKLYSDFILPTYTQLPVCLVKGKGSRVWDLEGREYIDFFPGWAVSGLGHCHPAVMSAVRNQLSKIMHISNNFLNLKQAELAQAISKASFPARLFFCNSGAEAMEAALKFARKFGSETGGRFEVISMLKSFHGRTYGAMCATGQDRIRKGFDPVVPGFKYAELNDLDSVKKLVTDKTVAIVLEPVSGEGGVSMATQEFMKALRALCDERNMLLILDEVQCCMGRTGKMFAYQHYGIEPDLMTLAKSLGNGVPIGALVVNKRIKTEVLTPGTHGSTYGGNPLVTAAGLAVFKTIQKDGLLKKASELGAYLGETLESLRKKYPVIEGVKGIGMMRGLELNIPGAPVVDAARSKGLLINCTQEKIIRIMPPITIAKSLLRKGLEILDESLQTVSQKQA